MPGLSPYAGDMTPDTEIADLLHAMGHPLRIAILRVLDAGALTVGQIQARTGEPQALVSRHLAILRGAGLLRADRGDADARAIFYSVSDPRVARILSTARPSGDAAERTD